MKKVKLQMKTHFFGLIDPISIMCFRATIALTRDTKCIYEQTGMLVLPFFVKNALATTSNSRIFSVTHIASVVVTVITVERTAQKELHRSYPEVANHLLKKFANDQAFAEMDSTTLRYTQPANITSILYGDDLYAKS